MKVTSKFLLISATLIAGNLLCMELPEKEAPKTENCLIKRKDFFSAVTGMSEEEFRHKYGWHHGVLTKMPDIKQWIKEYPSRAAIFQGQFNFYSIRDLDNMIGKNPKPLTHKPQFTILIHDPSNPKADDIAAMQANPANKNKVFQLASTFYGPLEGGMYRWDSRLTNMLGSPVQGEEASISAAGATIFRKYFMPTFNAPQNKPKYYYLLYYLKDILPTKMDDTGLPHIIEKDLHKYKFNPSDIKKVGIGLHDSVVVTGDYSHGRSPEDFIELVPATIDDQGKINLGKTQLITQVFTAAYNLNSLLKKDEINQNVKDFAKMVLTASYEATLKAAYIAGKPQVILTLVGGGAFRNEIKWIYQALNRPEIINFIKQTGLQVTILYRADKIRKNPIRTASEDIKFLKNLRVLADTINGTKSKNDELVHQLIETYVNAAYTYTQKQDEKSSKLYKESAEILKQMLL